MSTTDKIEITDKQNEKHLPANHHRSIPRYPSSGLILLILSMILIIHYLASLDSHVPLFIMQLIEAGVAVSLEPILPLITSLIGVICLSMAILNRKYTRDLSVCEF